MWTEHRSPGLRTSVVELLGRLLALIAFLPSVLDFAPAPHSIHIILARPGSRLLGVCVLFAVHATVVESRRGNGCAELADKGRQPPLGVKWLVRGGRAVSRWTCGTLDVPAQGAGRIHRDDGRVRQKPKAMCECVHPGTGVELELCKKRGQAFQSSFHISKSRSAALSHCVISSIPSFYHNVQLYSVESFNPLPLPTIPHPIVFLLIPLAQSPCPLSARLAK